MVYCHQQHFGTEVTHNKFLLLLNTDNTVHTSRVQHCPLLGEPVMLMSQGVSAGRGHICCTAPGFLLV